MIAIVGGGIAGLSAAYELSRRNVRFRLFEASGRLGGCIRTECIDGFTIEAGADSMLAQKRAAIDLCIELGLESHLIPTNVPRTAFVLHAGRLHPLPSPSMLGIPATWGGLLNFDLLPLGGRARLALEPLIARRDDRSDESIGGFFARRFGRATVDLLAQPLLGGIHSGDVSTLSMRALMPRLAEAEVSGSVLRWVQRVASSRDPDGAFRSLSGGMAEMVEAIRRRLPAESVELNAEVDALERGWKIRAGGREFDCSAVILATPAHAAARILADVDPVASGLCGRTAYTSSASVVLGFPRDAVGHPLNGTGFVVARRTHSGRMNACTWSSSKFSGRAPAGSVLLRGFFGGAFDPDAVALSDDELIALAMRELSSVLSIDGTPQLACAYRWRNASAQHDITHPARMEQLRQRLERLPGVFVTGSGFRTVGVPDCVADGRATAGAASRL